MTQRFDAIIIGTGQSGPPLAARLSGAGMKVAIIERGRFGGTCVNTGCIPTKTLIASAYAARLAQRAGEYGVVIDGPITVDMKRVKARKDAISGHSSQGVEQWLRGLEHGTVYQGHARFESAHAVRVGDARLEAERIFINVGGRALVPPMPGLDQVPYLTNASMMDVDFLPAHLIVVGGSYVGLEFGQMYRRFGARVTIVEKGPRLIQREDEDVSQAVREILENEGIDVQLGADCLSARRDADNVIVGLDCATGAREVAARICCSPSGACRIPTISGWTGPGSRPTRAATSGWTSSCAPLSPASGHWATATAAAHSPTRHTTTTRSSRPTCSTTTRARCRTASRPTPCSSTRRSAASA